MLQQLGILGQTGQSAQNSQVRCQVCRSQVDRPQRLVGLNEAGAAEPRQATQ